MLAEAQPERLIVPTILTGSNRGRPKTARRIRFRPTCHSCGRILPAGRRTYCDDCLPEARRDRGLSHVRVSTRRPSRAKRTYTSKKAERQAEAGRRRMADEAEWEPQHSGLRGPDPGEFAPIALGLQRFTASEIAGISGSRCRSRRDTGGASRCPTSVTGPLWHSWLASNRRTTCGPSQRTRGPGPDRHQPLSS